MPLLKTTCGRCGEIELPVARVLLRINEADDTGVCVIRCPDCGDRFVKETNEAMMVMLLAIGIEVSVWSPAPEGGDAGTRQPISHAELLEFRRRLVNEHDVLRHLASF